MTNEGSWYKEVGRKFARHETVKRREDEYVRGEAHTNTAEGFFSIFKRGNAWRLPALQREAFAPISCRV
jgi:hypothetical protein